MKRILILTILLLVPTIAGAQNIVSETWSTYCDNGVEKVRLSMVWELPFGVEFVYAGVVAFNDDCHNGCDARTTHQAESLGNDLYLVAVDGWLRSCLSTDTPSREGQIWYNLLYDFEWRLAQSDIPCAGPQPIVDEVDCVPLAVAVSTWGAIKALYRDSEGRLP